MCVKCSAAVCDNYSNVHEPSALTEVYASFAKSGCAIASMAATRIRENKPQSEGLKILADKIYSHRICYN